MASRKLTDTLADHEAVGEFNFDDWIAKCGFHDFKDAFVRNGMCTTDAISTSNPHFVALLSDPSVLQQPQRIAEIMKAIQSLQSTVSAAKAIATATNTTSDKFYLIDAQEMNTLKQLNTYKAAMSKLQDEYKSFHDNYESNKQGKKHKIEQYTAICNQQLQTMKQQINERFDGIQSMVSQKRNELLSEINEYESAVAEIQKNEGITTSELDETLNACHTLIRSEQQHFEQQILDCKRVIKQQDNGDQNQDPFMTEIDDARKQRVQQIAKNGKSRYEEKMNEIKQQQKQIRDYVAAPILSDFDGVEKEYYWIQINQYALGNMNAALKALVRIKTRCVATDADEDDEKQHMLQNMQRENDHDDDNQQSVPKKEESKQEAEIAAAVSVEQDAHEELKKETESETDDDVKLRGSLYFQTDHYDVDQMKNIEEKWKTDYAHGPRLVFGDNHHDKTRGKHVKREWYGGQSKVLGAYDRSFAFGISTAYRYGSQDKFTFSDENFKSVMEAQFKELYDHLLHGGDVIIPYPSKQDLQTRSERYCSPRSMFSRKKPEQVVFHNLGTGIAKLSLQHLLVIQQQIDRLKTVASSYSFVEKKLYNL